MARGSGERVDGDIDRAAVFARDQLRLRGDARQHVEREVLRRELLPRVERAIRMIGRAASRSPPPRSRPARAAASRAWSPTSSRGSGSRPTARAPSCRRRTTAGTCRPTRSSLPSPGRARRRESLSDRMVLVLRDERRRRPSRTPARSRHRAASACGRRGPSLGCGSCPRRSRRSSSRGSTARPASRARSRRRRRPGSRSRRSENA